jgi:hypothetical protein
MSTESQTSSCVIITNRTTTACRCGCCGRDSQHAKSFKRVVVSLGTCKLTSYGDAMFEIREVGEARLPYGNDIVFHVYSNGRSWGWHTRESCCNELTFDRDNIDQLVNEVRS